MKHALLLVLLIFFPALPLCVRAAPTPLILYVAIDGRDSWSGRLAHPDAAHTDGPLASPAEAVNRLRLLARSGRLTAAGVVVEIERGSYFLAAPLTLMASDKISPAPVVFQAVRGERVVLEGGREVSNWTPVTDPIVLLRLPAIARGHVLQADLRAIGITDYGQLSPRGFGRPMQPAALELFFNDQPMTLSRWPSPGSWATVAAAPGSISPDRFGYTGEQPSRWSGDSDIWVHGYWGFDWADFYEKVAHIDTRNHQIVTDDPQPPYGYKPGYRWYALNVLEELGSPGEWYLDRTRGVLYFWPPSDIRKEHAVVSIAGDLVRLDSVSHVTLRGLILQDGRGTAVDITNGAGDLIEDCVLRNMGNRGVNIEHGDNTGLWRCEITQTGDGAVWLSGGDRQTLAPGDCFVEDCSMHNYARWVRTYTPAVSLDGVGNRVSHCHIFDAPHQAIAISGNDHLIEFNEIDHVCQETGDAGAVYIGRDWTMRGNVIRFNFFHDIGGAKGLVGYSDTMAVYLDDMACGSAVYGNLFVRASHAILIGGGRDNKVLNNIFVDCRPAVSLDARGLTWAAKSLGTGGVFQQRLAAVPYDRPPYSIRYPDLATMARDNPGQPKGNVIDQNIVVRCPGWLQIAGEVGPLGAVHEKNLVDIDPLFMDPARGDFRLKAGSPAFALGFQQIPLNQIGPRLASPGTPTPALRATPPGT